MTRRWMTLFAVSATVVAFSVPLAAQLESIDELRTRAEAGNADAQYNLGFRYVAGLGVPQDDAEAVRWYRLAAEQGDADAQFNLGVMYDSGKGVPLDDAEAVRWYRLAADQGYDAAQYNLGLMYANGTGVPQDYVQVHMWFNLAASRSTAIEREGAVIGRKIVEGVLTADQLTEALRLAREWNEAHPR